MNSGRPASAGVGPNKIFGVFGREGSLAQLLGWPVTTKAAVKAGNVPAADLTEQHTRSACFARRIPDGTENNV